MSEKLRRQKDIIKNNTESYLNAVTDYQDYFEAASPILITYYQILDEASRTDTDLEDVHEVVGTNSPLKYCRIKHLPARGMAGLDIDTQLTQRGLESFVNGEFVLSPSAGIIPRAGEFFTFEDEISPELNQNLFQITDVQFDRATSQKFYKCSYKLYALDADNIYSAVKKYYIYKPTGNGNKDGIGDSILITEEENDFQEATDNMVDSLIDKFEELFYDEGMDTFVYQRPLDQSGTNFEYYWAPYVCHFIYKNDILEKSQREFLTEIYVQDINEREFPNIYSEEGYRKSIFYSVETGDYSNLEGNESSFLEVSAYDLSKPLNLPFFTSGEKYYLIDNQHKFNEDFWLGAFNWVYDDETKLYKDIDGTYRYVDNRDSDSNIPGIIDYLNRCGFIELIDDEYKITPEGKAKILGQTFYEMENANVDISKIEEMIRIPKNETSVLYSSDLVSIIQNSSYLTDLSLLMNIIKNYLYSPESFTINQVLLDDLNKFYYENTLQTYLLLPMVIYILQNSKGEVIKHEKKSN